MIAFSFGCRSRLHIELLSVSWNPTCFFDVRAHERSKAEHFARERCLTLLQTVTTTTPMSRTSENMCGRYWAMAHRVKARLIQKASRSDTSTPRRASATSKIPRVSASPFTQIKSMFSSFYYVCFGHVGFWVCSVRQDNQKKCQSSCRQSKSGRVKDLLCIASEVGGGTSEQAVASPLSNVVRW